ncbi:MAG TPA: FmdE family protein, partial [Candidatus Ozemobacteraceae bacterium]|nr:FmdE family protein [Candidatus Ozemobacteraceae bacterium]
GAQKILGYEAYPSKDLIVITEIDRCLTDAVISVTGCRLGRKTLKFRDWGRFAATFCSLERKEGLRISQRAELFEELGAEMQKRGIDRHDSSAASRFFFDIPWDRHFSMSVSPVVWDENDLPGLPKIREICVKCGEMVMDGHHVMIDNKPHCRPCTSK